MRLPFVHAYLFCDPAIYLKNLDKRSVLSRHLDVRQFPTTVTWFPSVFSAAVVVALISPHWYALSHGFMNTARLVTLSVELASCNRSVSFFSRSSHLWNSFPIHCLSFLPSKIVSFSSSPCNPLRHCDEMNTVM